MAEKTISVEFNGYKKHTNSWVVHLRDDLWESPGIRDMTLAIRQAVKD
ncbi:MAG: hypothetical protein AB1510_10845 [Bacillota bacterium]